MISVHAWQVVFLIVFMLMGSFRGSGDGDFDTITSSAPGLYTFTVTVCNNENVPAPFWEKLWFLLLLVVIFAVISYYSIANLKRFIKALSFWKHKKMVGPYRLEDRIGSGGMADIYSAVYKKKGKYEKVAIKLMKEKHSLDPVQRERFLQEGMIVDAISHPNIVDIFQRGESGKYLYIVMELLDGQTLGQLIRKNGMLDIDFSLDVMRQVTSALVAIHKAGVVHRDLKPENIMLVKKGKRSATAKILDFGLAKTQALPQITESGMMVGTICYLSPEQLYDNQYSPASDIYALGAIFFEAVTGVKSYSGDTALEIMQKILKNQPPLPGAIRPDLPRKLDTLILDMMAKVPEARPSAEELLITLEKLSTQEPRTNFPD